MEFSSAFLLAVKPNISVGVIVFLDRTYLTYKLTMRHNSHVPIVQSLLFSLETHSSIIIWNSSIWNSEIIKEMTEQYLSSILFMPIFFFLSTCSSNFWFFVFFPFPRIFDCGLKSHFSIFSK